MSAFTQWNETYRSDLMLGERYRDKATGVVGTLVAIAFYEHACERGTLRHLDGMNRVCEVAFDAPELVRLDTDLPARQQKTGGPDRGGMSRGTASR